MSRLTGCSLIEMLGGCFHREELVGGKEGITVCLKRQLVDSDFGT
ncbi:MAG: hypothetical protein R3245_10620 [Kiloniellales bacterium]|nr:hypothetical protein [Kiloniellales bacterium]